MAPDTGPQGYATMLLKEVGARKMCAVSLLQDSNLGNCMKLGK